MRSEPSGPETLTCVALDERLEDYLAGALEAAQESVVARHLTVCPRCAGEAALGERVAFELTQLPVFDASPELLARIKRRVREERAPVVTLASRRRGRLLWPAALAAGLLMAALALGWWQGARPTEPTAAEIAAAEQQARYALALVAQIGRRAGAEVRQGVLIERVATPLVEGVSRSLQRAAVKNGEVTS